MTVDATNVIMTATVDAIARRVDIPGVEGEMSDHGHPVVVYVGFFSLRARAVPIRCACLIFVYSLSGSLLAFPDASNYRHQMYNFFNGG